MKQRGIHRAIRFNELPDSRCRCWCTPIHRLGGADRRDSGKYRSTGGRCRSNWANAATASLARRRRRSGGGRLPYRPNCSTRRRGSSHYSRDKWWRYPPPPFRFHHRVFRFRSQLTRPRRAMDVPSDYPAIKTFFKLVAANKSTLHQ